LLPSPRPSVVLLSEAAVDRKGMGRRVAALVRWKEMYREKKRARRRGRC